ncbi:ABC-F family ATP-binding cassette domain-containing protein [Elizabethkingia meningoseptica]|uniref:ABC-F family ATP-binding cassette domain-containing protein n=1 Tax=Elizabethkingia meningoseptica TaxID=238 RepID=UPI000332C250|nr:ABC-F family ATP-binding cassette domain-containing protein [Elizabethkingia meningoseptica]EOR29217.1 ABC transporter related protein [Elizabethkingia meningoseptica ATCC 13253 = NBRC 12535]
MSGLSDFIYSNKKKEIMLTIQNLTYQHPDKDVLFDNINITISKNEKIALVGNNGSGKSTLLKLISGVLLPTAGSIKTEGNLYYIPQILEQFNQQCIASVLGVQQKLNALKEILDGHVTKENMTVLNDDWDIEERTKLALENWGLAGFTPEYPMNKLSGGQKTKVLLSGIDIHQPDIILMDEPTNHLDRESSNRLYEFVENSGKTMVIVSHDRTLLNLLPKTAELTRKELVLYGGNYDFYKEQKLIQQNALQNTIKNTESALKKAKQVERETLERQQKQDARGKKKQEKSGVARIMMNTLRNNAENSTAKIKDTHADKVDGISNELHELRRKNPLTDQMKFGFDQTSLHYGKILIKAEKINYTYQGQNVWNNNPDILVNSGNRIVIAGKNGSGKTTLIKLLLGLLEPSEGSIYQADFYPVYIDQDYSLLDLSLSVIQQVEAFNVMPLPDHEVKTILSRFLFTKETWDKSCSVLSGGERMRLLLACLSIKGKAPDIIVLDEPTNNLDIQNIEILTHALKDYKGTLLVVSHDDTFLKEINAETTINL